MLRTRYGLLIAGILIALVATGCGGGGSSEPDLANEEEWTWLQETQQELNAKRQELAEVQAAAALAATEEVADEVAAEEVEGEAVEPAVEPVVDAKSEKSYTLDVTV